MGNATAAGVVRGRAGRVLLAAAIVGAIGISTGAARAAHVPRDHDRASATGATITAQKGGDPSHRHGWVCKGRKVG